MDTKEKVFLQIILTLPIDIFTYIYASNKLLYLAISIILTLLVIYNIIRILQKKNILEPPFILILTISFLLFALNGLGNKSAPETFEKIDKSVNKKEVELKFNESKHINKVCYYFGINRDINFKLGYSNGYSWQKFYEYKDSFPYSFRWNCIKTDIITSKIGILVTKGEAYLGEIEFFDDKNRTIPYTTNLKKLNDEQNIKPDKSYYSSMFFDEIYFGRTAYEILHKLQIYETTHPFLGKALISYGIKLFGMTPFGWRVVDVIFGALIIVALYYLALVIFKEQKYAIFSATLITYSFMHLTQARVSLIDTFGVFFVILSFMYLFIFLEKQKLRYLLLSGLFFGLAGGVKWSGLFSSIGFLGILIYIYIIKYPLRDSFRGYRIALYGLFSYIVVGLLVYYLTFYIYMENNSFDAILKYQVDMYKYHSQLKATHPYSSEWYSWIVDYKPMCYYRESVNGLFSSITVFGNPAIFWTGILGVFILACNSLHYKRLESGFILFAFLGLYLPYIFIGRLMFIYHFYYAVPFLILAITYLFKNLFKSKTLFYGYLIVVIGLFLAFYPVLSGIEVAKSYVDNYLVWFKHWWL
jgi:predicted membrane-bound dolichyl-phosphate-mannose-protein mannosyltransferase